MPLTLCYGPTDTAAQGGHAVFLLPNMFSTVRHVFYILRSFVI